MTAAIQIPTELNALTLARATIRDPDATDYQLSAACETLMLLGDWMDYECAHQVRIAMREGLPLITPQSSVNEIAMRHDTAIAALDMMRRAAPYLLAAAVIVVAMAAAAQAPGKVRADLRLIEAMDGNLAADHITTWRNQ